MLENTLKNWSAKKLKMYRSCPYSVYLKYVRKVPEPPPNPKYDEKRQRGIRLHDELRDAINAGAPVPSECKKFADIIAGYIDLGAVAEEDEFFDRQWNKLPPTTKFYDPHWLVVKKDVRVLVPGEVVIVGDWKSGKKHGNEMDHFEQMVLYAVTEYVQDPGYPEYAVELQYIDQNDTWAHSFKPHELERHLQRIEKDVTVMFSDTLFRPRPSLLACRYCPYNLRNGLTDENGSPVCPVAVC